MKKYNIPTAAYEKFTSPDEALRYLETAKFPIVLKADGLALGKGVLICNTLEEAKDGVREIMQDKKFGTAGNTMVVEEFMTGREVSVLSFVDGKTIKIMSSAQDHKRAKDGDQGLNTGGMGTFSPSPFYTEEVDAFCRKYVYQATVDAMAAEGRPFQGVIFFGLMLTADGPRVLEYNARFGDPEAQVVLPRMKNDIIDVMEACVDGRLDEINLQFEDNAAVCVVLASDGYPVSYEKGSRFTGLRSLRKRMIITVSTREQRLMRMVRSRQMAGVCSASPQPGAILRRRAQRLMRRPNGRSLKTNICAPISAGRLTRRRRKEKRSCQNSCDWI